MKQKGFILKPFKLSVRAFFYYMMFFGISCPIFQSRTVEETTSLRGLSSGSHLDDIETMSGDPLTLFPTQQSVATIMFPLYLTVTGVQSSTFDSFAKTAIVHSASFVLKIQTSDVTYVTALSSAAVPNNNSTNNSSSIISTHNQANQLASPTLYTFAITLICNLPLIDYTIKDPNLAYSTLMNQLTASIPNNYFTKVFRNESKVFQSSTTLHSNVTTASSNALSIIGAPTTAPTSESSYAGIGGVYGLIGIVAGCIIIIALITTLVCHRRRYPKASSPTQDKNGSKNVSIGQLESQTDPSVASDTATESQSLNVKSYKSQLEEEIAAENAKRMEKMNSFHAYSVGQLLSASSQDSNSSNEDERATSTFNASTRNSVILARRLAKKKEKIRKLIAEGNAALAAEVAAMQEGSSNSGDTMSIKDSAENEQVRLESHSSLSDPEEMNDNPKAVSSVLKSTVSFNLAHNEIYEFVVESVEENSVNNYPMDDEAVWKEDEKVDWEASGVTTDRGVRYEEMVSMEVEDENAVHVERDQAGDLVWDTAYKVLQTKLDALQKLSDSGGGEVEVKEERTDRDSKPRRIESMDSERNGSEKLSKKSMMKQNPEDFFVKLYHDVVTHQPLSNDEDEQGIVTENDDDVSKPKTLLDYKNKYLENLKRSSSQNKTTRSSAVISRSGSSLGSHQSL